MLIAIIILVTIVLIVIVQKLGVGNVELGSGSGTGTRGTVNMRMPFWDRHVRELGRASENLFDFLEELSYSPRCVQMLSDLPGMESVERENLSMSINPRLGMIVYADLIDCFSRLGHSPWELDNLEGVGLAMMVGLISSPNCDVTRFYDRWQCHEVTKTLGTAIKNFEVKFDIEDCEDELRFVFIFSSVYDEKDWTQRYRTLVYRWASLIAKADGKVTDCESEALAKIMCRRKSGTGAEMAGDVRVSGGSAHQFSSSTLKGGKTDAAGAKPKSKPGLQSRFNRYIDFPDYNAEELAQIFLNKTEECQYTCNADVRASIVDIMTRAVEMKDRNFGNGRYVRNLFENAIQRQAVRLSSQSPLTTEMLAELTLHDLGFKYD